jgi:spermidine synthase
MSGAVIMALELVAFRLYAPYFGYSIYVWGSMISVVLLALAIGYGLGGRLADKSASDLLLHVAVFLSALYQLLIIFIARGLLSFFAQGGDFSGTVIATLVIFAPSMIALAVAGPFVIRLLARAGHVGATAGQVYALSTAGSMAGILSTSFFLLPHYGTQTTLQILCAITALTGVFGLITRHRAAVLAMAPFALLWFVPQVFWSDNTIWTRESAYNLIRVVRQGDRTILMLNSRNSVHTVRDQATGWTGRYYDDFALGPLLAPSQRALSLGMGGGGSIHAARLTAPGLEFDAVEIDPLVVEAAQRFFGLLPDARLRIHVADARPWLMRSPDHFDLVQLDLYHGGPYVPFYLTTVEFFRLVRGHMRDESLLMMNLFDVGERQEISAYTVATLRQVFPTVILLPGGFSGNNIVFAFAHSRSLDTVRQRLAAIQGDQPWQQLARKAATQIIEPKPLPGAIVFTDDRAPIDEMTRRMLSE